MLFENGLCPDQHTALPYLLSARVPGAGRPALSPEAGVRGLAPWRNLGASLELLIRTLGTLAAPQLTEREREVLQLLAGGLSNRTIAERLGILERTVKAQVSD